MNSVFVNPGLFYSCAVGAFLEISTHLFFFHMYEICVLGMSLQTCFSMFFSHYQKKSRANNLICFSINLLVD